MGAREAGGGCRKCLKSLNKMDGKIQAVRKISSLCRVAQESASNAAKVWCCDTTREVKIQIHMEALDSRSCGFNQQIGES
ncbi:uncharacterized protein J5F26_003620 isoform 2-T9 [Ciconia maguari]